MAGGVSAAIASLTGSAIREEVSAPLPLSIGTIAAVSFARRSHQILASGRAPRVSDRC